MNNKVTIQNDNLIVEPQGMDKIWGFKGKFTIPLEHVMGATADSGIIDEYKGIRAPGLGMYPIKWAGTFHKDGEKNYWNVSRLAKNKTPLVIQLRDEEYNRLVLSVDNPRALEDEINQAIG